MSLWTKPVSSMTFQDVEDFCQAEWEEGVRLDYKRDVPKDLPARVASFANTLGGIIVFGVDVNRSTNKPLWPPAGIPKTKGFSERITQICMANIYPPILPSIGPPLTDPTNPDLAVAVVRVDQSLEAPHAIQNKTRVCIRTGDVTECFALADIDRIHDLLRRRTQSQQRSATMLQQHFVRIRTFMSRSEHEPWAWWRVEPAYVWQPICSAEECIDAALGTLHGAPNGAFCFHPRGERKPEEYKAVTVEGDFFRAHIAATRSVVGGVAVRMDNLAYQTQRSLEFAQAFYRKTTVNHPGMLRLSIGLKKVHGVSATFGELRDSGVAFPDDSMAAETIVTYEEFNDADFSISNDWSFSLSNVAHHLFSQVVHAFSLGTVPKRIPAG